MYHGKHEKKRTINKNLLVLGVALLLICLVGTSSTMAYLIDKTDELSNTFIPGEVECMVLESFDYYEKNNVKIKNTGNTDAYIRTAVVVNWRDEDGYIYGKQPVNGVDYTIQYNLNTGGWMRNQADGYYYLVYPLAADAESGPLIVSCKAVEGKVPEGCRLSVEIIPQAIQSEPTSVVKDMWKVPMNGIYINLSGVGVNENV